MRKRVSGGRPSDFVCMCFLLCAVHVHCLCMCCGLCYICVFVFDWSLSSETETNKYLHQNDYVVRMHTCPVCMQCMCKDVYFRKA